MALKVQGKRVEYQETALHICKCEPLLVVPRPNVGTPSEFRFGFQVVVSWSPSANPRESTIGQPNCPPPTLAFGQRLASVGVYAPIYACMCVCMQVCVRACMSACK